MPKSLRTNFFVSMVHESGQMHLILGKNNKKLSLTTSLTQQIFCPKHSYSVAPPGFDFFSELFCINFFSFILTVTCYAASGQLIFATIKVSIYLIYTLSYDNIIWDRNVFCFVFYMKILSFGEWYSCFMTKYGFELTVFSHQPPGLI